MRGRAATRRLATVGAALALAAAAGGCGGGGETSSSAPASTGAETRERPATVPEREAITTVVHEYLRGLRELDAKRYCAAFTESQRNFIAQSHGGDDCRSGQRKAWHDAEGQLGAVRARRLYRAYAKSKVFDVRVSGDSANAGLDVPPEAAPLSGADSVSLSREGGRWLIDDQIGG